MSLGQLYKYILLIILWKNNNPFIGPPPSGGGGGSFASSGHHPPMVDGARRVLFFVGYPKGEKYNNICQLGFCLIIMIIIRLVYRMRGFIKRILLLKIKNNYDCTAGVLNAWTAGGEVNKNSIDDDLTSFNEKISLDSTKSGDFA